jgi:hypothetical protein
VTINPGDRVGVRFNGKVVTRQVCGVSSQGVAVHVCGEVRLIPMTSVTSVELRRADPPDEYKMWRAGRLLIG